VCSGKARVGGHSQFERRGGTTEIAQRESGEGWR
jgi:hypothetical protein